MPRRLSLLDLSGGKPRPERRNGALGSLFLKARSGGSRSSRPLYPPGMQPHLHHPVDGRNNPIEILVDLLNRKAQHFKPKLTEVRVSNRIPRRIMQWPIHLHHQLQRHTAIVDENTINDVLAAERCSKLAIA